MPIYCMYIDIDIYLGSSGHSGGVNVTNKTRERQMGEEKKGKKGKEKGKEKKDGSRQ